MKRLHTLLMLILLLVANPGAAEQRWLEGEVLVIDPEGHIWIPSTAATIKLRGTEQSVRITPPQSRFKLPVPASAQAGSPLPLEVEMAGYSACVLPFVDLTGTPETSTKGRATALMVENNSLNQSTCGERLAMGIVARMNWQAPDDRHLLTLEPNHFIIAWARRYNLGVKQVGNTVEQWAAQVLRDDAQSTGSQKRLALASIVRGDYAAAVRHANSMLLSGQKMSKRNEQDNKRIRREIATALNLEGLAHDATGDFKSALRAYEQAIQHIKQEEDPQTWAMLMGNSGLAHTEISQSLEGEEVLRHSEESIKYYNQALKKYTQEQSPADWATIHFHIGNSLRVQGEQMTGQKGSEALEKSIHAYNQAFKVFRRNQTPLDWAAAQNSLGKALSLRGLRLVGETSCRLLSDAVVSHQAALDVYSEMRLQRAQAVVLHSLGNALLYQSQCSTGPELSKRLLAAEQALSEALKLTSRQNHPRHWARLKRDFGSVMIQQATLLDAGKKFERSDVAQRAFEDALMATNKKNEPLQWASIKTSICNEMVDRVMLAQEGHLRDQVDKTLTVCQEASTAIERRSPSLQLAMIQSQIGLSHQQSAILHENAKIALRSLKTAEEMFQKSLKTFTPEHHPRQWSWIQTQIGQTLQQMSIYSDKSAQRKLLTEAEEAHKKALGLLSREHSPLQWVSARSALGAMLMIHAEMLPDKEVDQMLREAVSIYSENTNTYIQEEISHASLTAHAGLAYALTALGWQQRNSDGIQMLKKSIIIHEYIVNIYRTKLHRANRAHALAKFNLANSQTRLGELLNGEERMQTFRQAISTYTEVLSFLQNEITTLETAALKAEIEATVNSLRLLTEPDTIMPSSPGLMSPSATPRAEANSTGTWDPLAAKYGERWLKGKILLVDSANTENRRAPAASANIRLGQFGEFTARSHPGGGSFKIPLPKTLQVGDTINFIVELEGYEIWQPIDGKIKIPSDLNEEFEILLRSTQFKPFLSEEDMEHLAEMRAQEFKLLIWNTKRPNPSDLEQIRKSQERFIKEKAGEYHVTPEELEAEFDRWQKETEDTQGADGRLAIIALVRGDLEKAAYHADKAIQKDELLLTQLGQGNPKTSENIKKTKSSLAKNLYWRGTIYLRQPDLDNALKCYERAFAQIRGDTDHRLRISLLLGISLVHTASTVLAPNLADSFSGPGARLHLESASEHASLAIKTLTPQRDPLNWALAQSSLARAEAGLGILDGGDKGRQRLLAAVERQKKVTTIHEIKQRTMLWATAQRELGGILSLLTDFDYESKIKDPQIYKDAIDACTAASRAFRREDMPTLSASASACLGEIYYTLGYRSEGADSLQAFSQAVAAFQQALEIFAREKEPLMWAGLQLQLGTTFMALGVRTQGAEAERSLKQALEAYQQAQAVCESMQQPSFCLQIQLARGAVFNAMARLEATKGDKDVALIVQLLNESLFITRTALQAIKKKEDMLPMWIDLQNRLAISFISLAIYKKHVQEQVDLYEDAVSAHCNIYQQIEHYRDEEIWAEVLARDARILESLSAHYDQRVTATPGDIVATSRLIELRLLHGRFEDVRVPLDILLTERQPNISIAIKLQLFDVAVLLLQGKRRDVPRRLNELRKLIASQPESFVFNGSNAPLRCLLYKDFRLTAWRKWFNELLDAIEVRGRNALLNSLDVSRRDYPSSGK